jgi:hypothetical protein
MSSLNYEGFVDVSSMYPVMTDLYIGKGPATPSNSDTTTDHATLKGNLENEGKEKKGWGMKNTMKQHNTEYVRLPVPPLFFAFAAI